MTTPTRGRARGGEFIAIPWTKVDSTGADARRVRLGKPARPCVSTCAASAAARSVERLARQPAQRLAILVGGARNDLGGQFRRRWRLVPRLRLEPVAHELLVVARRRDADAVLVGGPETRRVGGQDLVHEAQRAVGVQTELELRVGDDDAARRCIGRRLAVQRQRNCAHARRTVHTDALLDLREADVLVVPTELGLFRRREDRLRQLLGLAETLRQRDAADRTASLVVLPPRADQVAAHDRLDRERLQLARHHRPAPHLRALGRRYDALGIDAGQVVGHYMAEPVEPEIGQGVEHASLVGDRLGHHDVERAEPIGGDDQQLVAADGVGVAHLAAVHERQGLDAGFEKAGGHGSSAKTRKSSEARRAPRGRSA